MQPQDCLLSEEELGANNFPGFGEKRGEICPCYGTVEPTDLPGFLRFAWPGCGVGSRLEHGAPRMVAIDCEMCEVSVLPERSALRDCSGCAMILCCAWLLCSPNENKSYLWADSGRVQGKL